MEKDFYFDNPAQQFLKNMDIDNNDLIMESSDDDFFQTSPQCPIIESLGILGQSQVDISCSALDQYNINFKNISSAFPGIMKPTKTAAPMEAEKNKTIPDADVPVLQSTVEEILNLVKKISDSVNSLKLLKSETDENLTLSIKNAFSEKTNEIANSVVKINEITAEVKAMLLIISENAFSVFGEWKNSTNVLEHINEDWQSVDENNKIVIEKLNFMKTTYENMLKDVNFSMESSKTNLENLLDKMHTLLIDNEKACETRSKVILSKLDENQISVTKMIQNTVAKDIEVLVKNLEECRETLETMFIILKDQTKVFDENAVRMILDENKEGFNDVLNSINKKFEECFCFLIKQNDNVRKKVEELSNTMQNYEQKMDDQAKSLDSIKCLMDRILSISSPKKCFEATIKNNELSSEENTSIELEDLSLPVANPDYTKEDSLILDRGNATLNVKDTGSIYCNKSNNNIQCQTAKLRKQTKALKETKADQPFLDPDETFTPKKQSYVANISIDPNKVAVVSYDSADSTVKDLEKTDKRQDLPNLEISETKTTKKNAKTHEIEDDDISIVFETELCEMSNSNKNDSHAFTQLLPVAMKVHDETKIGGISLAKKKIIGENKNFNVLSLCQDAFEERNDVNQQSRQNNNVSPERSSKFDMILNSKKSSRKAKIVTKELTQSISKSENDGAALKKKNINRNIDDDSLECSLDLEDYFALKNAAREKKPSNKVGETSKSNSEVALEKWNTNKIEKWDTNKNSKDKCLSSENINAASSSGNWNEKPPSPTHYSFASTSAKSNDKINKNVNRFQHVNIDSAKEKDLKYKSVSNISSFIGTIQSENEVNLKYTSPSESQQRKTFQNQREESVQKNSPVSSSWGNCPYMSSDNCRAPTHNDENFHATVKRKLFDFSGPSEKYKLLTLAVDRQYNSLINNIQSFSTTVNPDSSHYSISSTESDSKHSLSLITLD